MPTVSSRQLNFIIKRSSRAGFRPPNIVINMQEIATIQQVRETVNAWHGEKQRVALVPTMGNLHAGHLQLVQAAKKIADRVVVSIFVNPMQFGQGEDFDSYPRTEREDAEKLREQGADLLFLPSAETIYVPEAKTVVSVNGLSDMHCGASRKGHFSGVATIVCKLFNIVQPDVAVFGEKDFQQLTIIRNMVRDLNLPVEISSVATVRESDGLAMSSRNGYLTDRQRAIAPLLYQQLLATRQQLLQGDEKYQQLESLAVQALTEAGFVPEYFSICRCEDLKPAGRQDHELLILVAARLGTTRLIDNIYFSRDVS